MSFIEIFENKIHHTRTESEYFTVRTFVCFSYCQIVSQLPQFNFSRSSRSPINVFTFANGCYSPRAQSIQFTYDDSLQIDKQFNECHWMGQVKY